MAADGVDALLLSVGPDLPYFTGYQAMASERLTMLVVTANDATLVIPRLEAPRLGDGPFVVRPWAETEDPLQIVADLAGGGTLAIGDHTWATFLLGLQRLLRGVGFVRASTVTAALRATKSVAEADALRFAGAAADRVSARLATMHFSGRSERSLAAEVAEMAVTEGHDESAFTIVASGPNAASPHHEPGERVMAAGDTVVVDFGGRVAGYHSDTTRTFHIAAAPHEVAASYQTLRLAQQAAIDAIRPGVPAGDIDRVARTIIGDAGLGDRFIHRTGHGIGLEVHEPPYLVEGNLRPLEVGMACSVEPGIYMPGRWGMRIEDIVLVIDGGAERLNRASRELVVVR